MKKKLRKKHIFLILAAILFITLFFYYSTKIDLTNSDIGRHIKNGELFFEHGQIIKTNTYSYTNTEFPTVTTHWLYGPIVYLIFKLFGLVGLSIFNTLIFILSIFLIFLISKKKGSKYLTIFLIFILIPLLTYRKEVRPEILSYLFFTGYYYLLTKFKNNEINFKKTILILIPLQILWVNTHIFFIFGIFLSLAFTLDSLVNKKERSKEFFYILIGLTLASLINPYFLIGLLEPFLIFKEYGYRLAENMSVFFMQSKFFNPIYLFFELNFLIGFTSFFISKKRPKENFLNIILFSVFSILAFSMIRNITIFSMILIPILVENLKNPLTKKSSDKFLLLISVLLIGSLIFSLTFISTNQDKGFGLQKDNLKSIEFYKENNLSGPIFNNYDMGEYLIFNLFPNEKVFVDNRPEAYPVSFFKEIYIPMQENESIWAKEEKKYNFNTIYFNINDITPWGQEFLISRVKDKEWIPIYVDKFAIIFVKNKTQNSELIKKYEISKNYFSF